MNLRLASCCCYPIFGGHAACGKPLQWRGEFRAAALPREPARSRRRGAAGAAFRPGQRLAGQHGSGLGLRCGRRAVDRHRGGVGQVRWHPHVVSGAVAWRVSASERGGTARRGGAALGGGAPGRAGVGAGGPVVLGLGAGRGRRRVHAVPGPGWRCLGGQRGWGGGAGGGGRQSGQAAAGTRGRCGARWGGSARWQRLARNPAGLVAVPCRRGRAGSGACWHRNGGGLGGRPGSLGCRAAAGVVPRSAPSTGAAPLHGCRAPVGRAQLAVPGFTRSAPGGWRWRGGGGQRCRGTARAV